MMKVGLNRVKAVIGSKTAYIEGVGTCEIKEDLRRMPEILTIVRKLEIGKKARKEMK